MTAKANPSVAAHMRFEDRSRERFLEAFLPARDAMARETGVHAVYDLAPIRGTPESRADITVISPKDAKEARRLLRGLVASIKSAMESAERAGSDL
jgi:hypothetical protein